MYLNLTDALMAEQRTLLLPGLFCCEFFISHLSLSRKVLPVFLKIQPSFSPLSTLIHDRDPLFQGRFPSILNSVGCKIKLIQPRCPEQNGYIESFIKTFKTECLNQVILRSVVQLRYVVNEFLIYYNRLNTTELDCNKMFAIITYMYLMYIAHLGYCSTVRIFLVLLV